jgi:hypothetical protein
MARYRDEVAKGAANPAQAAASLLAALRSGG